MQNPNMRNAGAGWHLTPGIESAYKDCKHLHTCSSGPSQELIFTAVPNGTLWQVKCISADGVSVRVGEFNHRLSALGAALLMSANGGGRVCL